MIGSFQGLAQLVWRRQPRLGGVRLVAVDGPTGGGKSVFARRLSRALGDAPVVRTDDLLDGWGDQFAFWGRLEQRVLGPLRAGRPARFRAYDWWVGDFRGAEVVVAPGPAVVLEGVTAARAEVRPELTLAVFVTAPPDLRLWRVLGRDGEAMREPLRVWMAGEERHFAADATARHVDVVVDGASLVEHDPVTQFVTVDQAAAAPPGAIGHRRTRGGCRWALPG